MKLSKKYFVMVGFCIAASCKPIKNLTSKDTSSAKPKSKTTYNQNRKVDFIDNIEVTPGSVVTSKHKTINTASKRTVTKPSKTTTKIEGDTALAKSNIENADYLQLKYAVLLDATVEKLTNIELLQTIDKWWGTRYCLGGSTSNCIDCSAFTQIIAKEVYGYQLPRTSQEQYNNSVPINMEELQEGDLVFFNQGGRSNRASHVGFYLRNNKFVHASTSSGVMISDLNDNYWKHRIKGAGRLKG